MTLFTYGMGSVQRNKIRGLNLNQLFSVVICTDEIGHDYWKPSSLPFIIALELLGVVPDAIYIGDNAQKDFVGANAVGIHTIWLRNTEKYNHDEKHTSNPLLKAHVKGVEGRYNPSLFAISSSWIQCFFPRFQE